MKVNWNFKYVLKELLLRKFDQEELEFLHSTQPQAYLLLCKKVDSLSNIRMGQNFKWKL